MKRTDLINALALVLALGVGMAFAWESGAPTEARPTRDDARVADATGHEVPVARYARIASASSIADQVLLRMLEPERIAAVTAHSTLAGPDPWRFEGFVKIESLERIETVVALQPDLVVVSNVMDARRIARLREAGLRVFDIGPMRGMETFVPAIRTLGRLTGEPRRAERIADQLEQRMARVWEGEPHHVAMYVGVVGGKIYGGTRGTNYHDVLTAAGVRDHAADAGLEGWPELTNEQLLELDPPWIVAPEGTGAQLCRFAGLDALEACRDGRVVEVEESILHDPGFGMLDAAEAVRDAFLAE